MLVQPWDEAEDVTEWRAWLADGRNFGQLVACDHDGWPVVVPTHFHLRDDRQALLHLARPNPVWRAVEANSRVALTVLDDYAYVPTTWRAPAAARREDGVPTSYYATVQLRCEAEIVDDAEGKADILRQQLEHLQPDGDFADVRPDAGPYQRLLPGIRGLRLRIVEVTAKFKFDDHKPAQHRLAVAEQLQRRNEGRDLGARQQQLRRLSAKTPPGPPSRDLSVDEDPDRTPTFRG